MNLMTEEEHIVEKNVLPLALMLLIVSMFGFFGNFTIVMSTILSKKLNSKCNILIALLAASDFVSQLSVLSTVPFALTGQSCPVGGGGGVATPGHLCHRYSAIRPGGSTHSSVAPPGVRPA